MLLRHGETEWSRTGRHTGRTDVPLTPHGEQLARAAGELVRDYDFRLVLTSPLQRARRTAELAGLDADIDPLLIEWDYGGYEGRTTKDIRAELGYNWSAFTHGVIRGETPGETVEEVAARASRVLTRVLPAMATGDVALVAHGHYLRILAAVFLRQAHTVSVPRSRSARAPSRCSVMTASSPRSWRGTTALGCRWSRRSRDVGPPRADAHGGPAPIRNSVSRGGSDASIRRAT